MLSISEIWPLLPVKNALITSEAADFSNFALQRPIFQPLGENPLPQQKSAQLKILRRLNRKSRLFSRETEKLKAIQSGYYHYIIKHGKTQMNEKKR